MDETTVKIGLLMEAAEANQQALLASLTQLRAHTCGLDGVVRDEIRRTLVDELHSLGSDVTRANEALRALGRSADMRVALWSIGIAALSCATALAVAWWMLPSAVDIGRLRAQHDRLALDVARLEKLGGRIDLQNCGEASRLCVRVERHSPAYGPDADYLVVKGY